MGQTETVFWLSDSTCHSALFFWVETYKMAQKYF